MSKILIFVIKIYQLTFSKFLTTLFGHACRFTPTCSSYTIEALEKYGAFKGVLKGFKRFLKCHPWGGSGYDPVN